MDVSSFLGGMSGQAAQDLKLRQINIERGQQGLPPYRSLQEMQMDQQPQQAQMPQRPPQRGGNPGGMNPQLLQLMQLLNR